MNEREVLRSGPPASQDEVEVMKLREQREKLIEELRQVVNALVIAETRLSVWTATNRD
jgi:hypothetical protein